MPEAAGLLLDAVERHVLVGEDRLTEVFAFALTRDAPLARELCECAGVPFRSDYRVGTQRPTPDGDRIDMEIVLRDRGRDVGRVLFEHKDDPATEWQPGQPDKYVAEAERKGPAGAIRVVVIVPDRAQAEAKIGSGDGRWKLLTWTQIGAWIGRLARQEAEAGGRRWRAEAARPDAPARQMVRHELIG